MPTPTPIRPHARFIAALAAALTLVAPPAGAQDPAWLATWGGLGSAPGQFNFAHHLAVSAATGDVYVGDLLNNRVQVLSSSGAFLRQWPLAGADGIALGALDTVLVVANDHVYKYTSAGVLVTSWGGTGAGDGQFQFALDVGVDSQGFVFVSDFLNHRVQKFDAAGHFLLKWGSVGNGAGEFQTPFGLMVDPNDDVWVADGGNNLVQRFDGAGHWLSGFGTFGTAPGQWDSPGRPCRDADGRLLVPDAGNARVQAYTPSGQFLLQWGVPGSGNGQFNHPTTVAVSPAGEVLVLDKDNHRIQVFASVATPARRRTWGAVKSSHR
jgi:tripartite motif-containing protein 71